MSKLKVHYVGSDGSHYCSAVLWQPYSNISRNVDEVTCKSCKKTEQFKKAANRAGKKKVEATPTREESYEERQAEWIKENEVKVGDMVQVTRTAESFENGWENTRPEDALLYTQMRVTSLEKGIFGIRLSDEYNYPYFVLDKVVEETENTPDTIAKVSEEALELLKDAELLKSSIEPYSEIEHRIIQDLWSVMCGTENNLEATYFCIEFQPECGFAIFAELNDKSPKMFKVTVQEMELVEKRKEER